MDRISIGIVIVSDIVGIWIVSDVSIASDIVGI
jgi:hypothetical protein